MIAQCIALAVSASAACRPYVGSLLACMMMAFFEALGALSSFWSLGGPFHTCCIACMAVFVMALPMLHRYKSVFTLKGGIPSSSSKISGIFFEDCGYLKSPTWPAKTFCVYQRKGNEAFVIGYVAQKPQPNNNNISARPATQANPENSTYENSTFWHSCFP